MEPRAGADMSLNFIRNHIKFDIMISSFSLGIGLDKAGVMWPPGYKGFTLLLSFTWVTAFISIAWEIK